MHIHAHIFQTHRIIEAINMPRQLGNIANRHAQTKAINRQMVVGIIARLMIKLIANPTQFNKQKTIQPTHGIRVHGVMIMPIAT